MKNRKNELPIQESLFDEESGAIILEVLLSKAKLNTIRVDELAIDEEFIRGAGDLAFWNENYARAEKNAALETHEYKKTRARVWLELKSIGKTRKPKPPTDKDVEAELYEDDEHNEAELAMIEAVAKAKKAKLFADAVKEKQSNVRSFGAKLRTEMLSNPALRDQISESKKFYSDYEVDELRKRSRDDQ